MALALEIMSTPSLRHCTLIMLSSTGSRIDKAVLKKSGPFFLMKPIDAEELFAAMEQALMPMLPSAPAAAPPPTSRR